MAVEVKIGVNSYDHWPPEDQEHITRLENYRRCRLLFKGRHQDVWPRVQSWLEKEVDKGMVYVVCNFAGLLSKVAADMLFGEPVRLSIGDPESPEQTYLTDLVTTNRVRTLNYEMALSCSWRGEVIYKVRHGIRANQDQVQPRSIIEAVSPAIFYPIIGQDNIRGLEGGVFGWIKQGHSGIKGGPTDREYLRIERQLPGRIENELYLMDHDGRTISQRMKLDVFPEYANLQEYQETGIDKLLFCHVPNLRLEDEFYGLSDYYDLESIFDEMNNRVSRVSRVLDKHESPKLILPPGIMKWDDTRQRYYIEKEDLEAIEVDRKDQTVGGDLPKYLTWDAQLNAAFAHIDKLLEMAFLVSETSPDAFGLGKRGAAESGRALKFRLLRLLAKINRKKLYFDEAIEYTLQRAFELDRAAGVQGAPEDADLRREWADGIPDDPKEQSEIENTRTGGKATSSVRSAVRRLDGIEGKDLEDEVAAIDAEEAGDMGRPEDTTDRNRLIDMVRGAGEGGAGGRGDAAAGE